MPPPPLGAPGGAIVAFGGPDALVPAEISFLKLLVQGELTWDESIVTYGQWATFMKAQQKPALLEVAVDASLGAKSMLKRETGPKLAELILAHSKKSMGR